MSAGISYMYKVSKGFIHTEECSGCVHLKTDKKSNFGKNGGTLICNMHPDSLDEENFRHIWKPTYMACKYFESKKKPRKEKTMRKAKTQPKAAYKEERGGQLSFF